MYKYNSISWNDRATVDKNVDGLPLTCLTTVVQDMPFRARL